MLSPYTPIQLTIVDDFYADPEAVRARALAEGFAPSVASYPGLRTVEPYRPAELTRRIEDLLGRAIDWEATRHNGVFQVNRAEDAARAYVHVDHCDFAGLVYLSKAEGPGTGFYRHKASGFSSFPSREMAEASGARRGMDAIDVANQLTDDRFDLARWDPLMEVPYKFNRLVLYPAHQFHRNATAWGLGPSDARMTQIFFLRVRPS